jgi:hypothetical protein
LRECNKSGDAEVDVEQQPELCPISVVAKAYETIIIVMITTITMIMIVIQEYLSLVFRRNEGVCLVSAKRDTLFMCVPGIPDNNVLPNGSYSLGISM